MSSRSKSETKKVTAAAITKIVEFHKRHFTQILQRKSETVGSTPQLIFSSYQDICKLAGKTPSEMPKDPLTPEGLASLESLIRECHIFVKISTNEVFKKQVLSLIDAMENALTKWQADVYNKQQFDLPPVTTSTDPVSAVEVQVSEEPSMSKEEIEHEISTAFASATPTPVSLSDKEKQQMAEQEASNFLALEKAKRKQETSTKLETLSLKVLHIATLSGADQFKAFFKLSQTASGMFAGIHASMEENMSVQLEAFQRAPIAGQKRKLKELQKAIVKDVRTGVAIALGSSAGELESQTKKLEDQLTSLLEVYHYEQVPDAPVNQDAKSSPASSFSERLFQEVLENPQADSAEKNVAKLLLASVQQPRAEAKKQQETFEAKALAQDPTQEFITLMGKAHKDNKVGRSIEEQTRRNFLGPFTEPGLKTAAEIAQINSSLKDILDNQTGLTLHKTLHNFAAKQLDKSAVTADEIRGVVQDIFVKLPTMTDYEKPVRELSTLQASLLNKGTQLETYLAGTTNEEVTEDNISELQSATYSVVKQEQLLNKIDENLVKLREYITNSKRRSGSDDPKAVTLEAELVKQRAVCADKIIYCGTILANLPEHKEKLRRFHMAHTAAVALARDIKNQQLAYTELRTALGATLRNPTQIRELIANAKRLADPIVGRVKNFCTAIGLDENSLLPVAINKVQELSTPIGRLNKLEFDVGSDPHLNLTNLLEAVSTPTDKALIAEAEQAIKPLSQKIWEGLKDFGNWVWNAPKRFGNWVLSLFNSGSDVPVNNRGVVTTTVTEASSATSTSAPVTSSSGTYSTVVSTQLLSTPASESSTSPSPISQQPASPTSSSQSSSPVPSQGTYPPTVFTEIRAANSLLLSHEPASKMESKGKENEQVQDRNLTGI